MSAMNARRPTNGAMWEVLHEDTTLRVWAMRDVVGVVWFEAPTHEQVQELYRIGKLRGRAYPDGVGLFQVIVRGKPRFTDEVRADVERITRENTFARGGAHIILVEGLAGAAARAFLSTVLLMRIRRAPAKVFGEMPEAAGWLARTLGKPWHPSELERMGHALVESGSRPAPQQGMG